MSVRAGIRDELGRLGRLGDDDLELAETALLLSRLDRPRVSLDPYRRHLAKLADECIFYAGGLPACSDAGLSLQAEALIQVIAKRYGYGGEKDPGGGPDPANLTEAIDRRSGTAEALAILYVETAAAAGWTVEALDFPVRTLIRLERDGKRLILDPYAGGKTVGPVEMRAMLKARTGNDAELALGHHHGMTPRRLLLRLYDRIKARHLRRQHLDEALTAIETMLLIAPAEAGLWREAGLINARLDNVKAAVAALEEFMRRNESDSSRYSTSVLLQQLRGRLG